MYIYAAALGSAVSFSVAACTSVLPDCAPLFLSELYGSAVGATVAAAPVIVAEVAVGLIAAHPLQRGPLIEEGATAAAIPGGGKHHPRRANPLT